EAALIAAVLTPVAMHAPLRSALRPMRVPLLAMLALALAGQLPLSTRPVPFNRWGMVPPLPSGDPPGPRDHAQPRRGPRRPLGPGVPVVRGGYRGRERADGRMEALRRDHDPAALRALAKLSGEPVAAVLVSRRTISIRTGRKGPAHVVSRVEMR